MSIIHIAVYCLGTLHLVLATPLWMAYSLCHLVSLWMTYSLCHSVSSQLMFVFCLIVFNATFNNISIISWRSVLLVPEKTTDLSQGTDKLYHIMLCTLPWSRFELTTSVVIGTDCIGSCKSNYHTIAETMAPQVSWNGQKWKLLTNKSAPER